MKCSRLCDFCGKPLVQAIDYYKIQTIGEFNGEVGTLLIDKDACMKCHLNIETYIRNQLKQTDD